MKGYVRLSCGACPLDKPFASETQGVRLGWPSDRLGI